MNKSIHEYYTASVYYLQDEMKLLDRLLDLELLEFELRNLEAMRQSERIREHLSGTSSSKAGQHEDSGAIGSGDDVVANYRDTASAAILNEIPIIEDEIEKKATQSKKQGIDLRLITISDMFHLTKSETFILLICYAHHHSKKYGNIFQYLSNTKNAQFPSIALLHSLVSSRYDEHPSFHAFFSSTAPLIKNGLIEFVSEPNGAETPFWLRQVKISETVYRQI